MSVSLAVPAIPAGHTYNSADPRTQGGGLPGTKTLRVQMIIQSEVNSYINPADYGLDHVYIYGFNLIGTTSTGGDPPVMMAGPETGDPNNLGRFVVVTDGILTWIVEVWFLGR